MIHHASPDFWRSYGAFPADFRAHADRAFVLLKVDPHHPSLHFKKLGAFGPCGSGFTVEHLARMLKTEFSRSRLAHIAEYDRMIG